MGKVACVQNLLDFIKPDSVVITETKLNPSINTAEVIPPEWGCTVYRRDRLNLTRGGGVMLLIKDHYTSTEIHSSSDCEVIWAEVKLNKFQIDISKHVEEKSGKRGRMDGHCHGIIRPVFQMGV